MVGLDWSIVLFDRHIHLTRQKEKRLFNKAAVLRKTGLTC